MRNRSGIYHSQRICTDFDTGSSHLRLSLPLHRLVGRLAIMHLLACAAFTYLLPLRPSACSSHKPLNENSVASHSLLVTCFGPQHLTQQKLLSGRSAQKTKSPSFPMSGGLIKFQRIPGSYNDLVAHLISIIKKNLPTNQCVVSQPVRNICNRANTTTKLFIAFLLQNHCIIRQNALTRGILELVNLRYRFYIQKPGQWMGICR